jgi:hypothetical protein
MPEWIHNRASHIQAKNPSMPESEAWAIATQQAHATGEAPKGYGTAKGKKDAKKKYKTPGDDVKTADPGGIGKEAGLLDLVHKSLPPVAVGDDKIRAIVREEVAKSHEINSHQHQSSMKSKVASVFPFGFLEGFADELEKIAQLTMSSVAPKPTVSSQITAKMPRMSTSAKPPNYTQVNPASQPGPAQMHQPVLSPPPVRG